MRNKTRTALAMLAVTALAVGCAITDYNGIGGHRTTGEAKLWGSEISFSGFGADFDGTYSYTVRYSNGFPVTIFSYRNTVVSSFNRDGLVDKDGDDVQGNGGTLGGKFLPWIVSVDSAAGCQFGDNVTQDKGAGAGVFLCIDGFQEEVDKDFEVNASFGSLDDLIRQILAGTLTGRFDLELVGVTINGTTHPVDTLVIGATAAGARPTQFTVTNQRAFESLRQAILDNTNHLELVSLGLVFNGGLSISLPHNMSVAFDHNVVSTL